ncbi:hypothetical protein JCGZ_05317 [Jatropha curcas]|uniref:Uncharacterized protein n=1 Tax=Jatropha curcas TaxID=180498 RepID=A0A067L298_JATCU|nr:hypothetical protein JCGZ_05317 [Jatropha curcas]
MAPKKNNVTSKAAQTGASNSLNVRFTTYSSPDANIKINASQKQSTVSATNSSDIMSVMMTGTTSAEELDTLKLQLEALNRALQEITKLPTS